MKKHVLSLFSVLALTFLMISCGPENELITPITTSLNAEDYDAALAASDTVIAKEPTNGQGYYYKAYTLSRIAATTPVATDRKPILEEMRTNLLEADRLFAMAEEPPAEANNVLGLTIESWSREHNTGISYYNPPFPDEMPSEVRDSLVMSIAHLTNAITINPDSSLSYDALSQVNVMIEDYSSAAAALEKSMEIRGPQNKLSATDYDRLGSFYDVSENFDRAIEVLNEGIEMFPDNINLRQNLANSYIYSGQREESIAVLEELIERDPTNAQYYVVVGTSVGSIAQELTEEVSDNFDLLSDAETDAQENEIRANIDNLNSEIETLTARAEAALLKGAELDPTNFVTFNSLGIIYLNKAAILFEFRNAEDDLDEVDRLDAAADTELNNAMSYFEQARDIDPSNYNVWMSLFEVYTQLDLREKAEEAYNRASEL